MVTDILTRAIIALSIIGTGLCLFWLGNRVLVASARRKRRGLESLRPGVPGILYFTTPACIPCRTRQRPALSQLQSKYGDTGLQVIEINAAEQPDLADYWGVLSVPTTFIIDSRGRPRRVNHGIQSAEALEKQIQEVEQEYRLSLSKLVRSSHS